MSSFLLVAFLLAVPAAASDLTAEEQRGKSIYFAGESAAGGEIVAVIGDTQTEVPASVMPCGSCHGRDGRGRPEGGVYPSNLTWPVLTKPYGLEHPSGRKHPAYTERALKRAISMGIDPAGNPLHVAMPRYRLTHQDMRDLIAYLKRLGEDLDPGLAEDTITLATLLPREGPAAPLGAAMEAVLRAYFDDVNGQGGIYHRRLELLVEPAPLEATARAEALRRLLESGRVFALVGVFLPGAETEVLDVVEDLETPLAGPFTLYPEIDFFAPNPYVFYLLPGLEDLALPLVSFTEKAGAPPRAVILTGSHPNLETAAQAIAEKAADLGWPEPRTIPADSDRNDLEVLARSAIDSVFLLASGEEQAAFFSRAAALGWHPRVLLPGPLLGRGVFEASPEFDQRVFAAFPTLLSNQDQRSVGAYQHLAQRYGLPEGFRTAQITTLAGARVLVEGLKRSGRELSRGRLIEVLEGFVSFDTGLTPPVTYSPNRRVGVRGAYVMSVDLGDATLVPASGWIESR